MMAEKISQPSFSERERERIETLKKQLNDLMSTFPDQAVKIRDMAKQGKINGLYTYVDKDKGGCVLAYIAEAKGVPYGRELHRILNSATIAFEFWLFNIRTGDTPENSTSSKQLVMWLNEFIERKKLHGQ